MAGRYRSFTYEGGVYGDFGPTITQSYIFAQVVDYNSVDITLEVPDKIGQRYILVRSNHGTAEDPSDGATIESGVFTSGVVYLTDTTPSMGAPTYGFPLGTPIGTTYYTLFGLDEDGAWYKDAATSVVVPTDKGTTKKIVDLLPSMYTSEDSNPLSPTEYDSDLMKFLYAFGLTYDELSSMIDFILPENRDRHTTRRLSDIFITGVGMPSEYLIGVAANARLYRESGYIYRNKGTLNGIATFVEALTGWQTVVKESNNKFLSLDDGSFERSTGNWSWDSSDMSLTRLDIDEFDVTGPTVEYETFDYPFSRLAVGRAELLGSSARMSLPGSGNRLLSIPVTAGKSHYLAVPVRAESGTPVVVPSVEWLDQNGESISISSLSDVEAGEEWQVAGGPINAPATAYFAVIHIDISGISGDAVHLDMLSFSEEVARFRTNYFLNPAAESDLDNVGLVDATGRSLTTSTSQFMFGAQSFKLTSSNTTARTLGIQNSANIPAASGETFTGSAYVYSTKAASSFLTFTWKNGASTITTSTSNSFALAANTWTRIKYTVTAPASTTNVVFSVKTSTTYINTDSLFVDGILVEKSDRLGDWFAGSTGTTFGASGRYGEFVYSTYDVGYVYRDPRSVTVICQPDRINLVFDPSFELGTTSWAVDSGSLSLSSTEKVSGLKSAVATGSPWAFHSNDIPVVGDYAYSIAVSLKSAGAVSARVTWFDYTDSVIRTDNVDVPTSLTNWARAEDTVYAPKAAVYANLEFSGNSTTYLDNVLFERADRPQIFFSGNNADLDNQDGRWSGGSANSYSLLYNNAPVKLGRLLQTLPYYLPVGVTGRVLLWDSLDPEVQSLIPRGIYEN